MFPFADSAFSTGFIPAVSVSSLPSISVPVPASLHTSTSPVDSDGGLMVCWDSATTSTIFTSAVGLTNVRSPTVSIEVTVGGGTSLACNTVGDFDGRVLVNGTQRPIFISDVRVIPDFGINVHPFSLYRSISIQDSTATTITADGPTFQALKQANGFFYAKLTPKVQAASSDKSSNGLFQSQAASGDFVTAAEFPLLADFPNRAHTTVPAQASSTSQDVFVSVCSSSFQTEPTIKVMSSSTPNLLASVLIKPLDLAPAEFILQPALYNDTCKYAPSSIKIFNPGV
jgi:hypothetical protein